MNQIPRNQLIILIVLGIAIVGVLGYQFMGGGGGASTASRSTAKKTPAEEVVRFEESKVQIDDLLDAIKVVDFDYAAARIGRDPFAPLVGLMAENAEAAADATASLPGQNRMEILQKKISGIVWDQFDPRAVIDNEVVGIGHAYPSGVQVHNIEEKRVTFRDGDSLIHRDLEDSAQ